MTRIIFIKGITFFPSFLTFEFIGSRRQSFRRQRGFQDQEGRIFFLILFFDS